MTPFEEVFAALQSVGARYVVVGGVAVNLHGYQRFTKDLDLVVELVPHNTRLALQALQGLGYKPGIPVKASDFIDPQIRASWSRDKGMVVFQMYSDRSRVTVDIFVEHPLPFEALWSQAGDHPQAAAGIRRRQMSVTEPAPGSFEAARLFRLKLALQATPAQRLQDLQDMIEFNARAEEMNPRLRAMALKLRNEASGGSVGKEP
jgi:hypothetical protein